MTPRENIIRGTSPIAAQVTATHCKNGHAWTPENTRPRRDHKGRVCIACAKAYSRDAFRRKSKRLAS